MPPIAATVNLQHVDLDHHRTREIPSVSVSVTDFGEWSSDITIAATTPEQLESFAETLLVAARDFRTALAQYSANDPAGDVEYGPAEKVA